VRALYARVRSITPRGLLENIYQWVKMPCIKIIWIFNNATLCEIHHYLFLFFLKQKFFKYNLRIIISSEKLRQVQNYSLCHAKAKYKSCILINVRFNIHYFGILIYFWSWCFTHLNNGVGETPLPRICWYAD
jgi:hypothetical protein